MSAPDRFRVVVIPTLDSLSDLDATSKALAERFRELRLRSFKLAPDAFASKYEEELQQGLDATVTRLSNDKAIHFIAIDNEGLENARCNDVQALENGGWVGMIVLLGPQEDDHAAGPMKGPDPFMRMTSADRNAKVLQASEHIRDTSALHFHLNGMFVDPTVQKAGLGSRLVHLAIDRAKAEAAKHNATCRITITAYDHNVAACRLYEKAGLKILEKWPSMTKGPDVTAVGMGIFFPRSDG